MLFSNEIVFMGHPDKVCDQIGDAILDEFLRGDSNSRVGIEVTGGKKYIYITGEVNSSASVDVEYIAKKTLKNVGYNNNNIKVINDIGIQSPDISQGVDIGGAGDQGMMFGYACRDTPQRVPVAMALLQDFSKEYNRLVFKYPGIFLPDGKAMLTARYEGRKIRDVISVLVSYQVLEENREKYNTDQVLTQILKKLLVKYNLNTNPKILFNPTGKFEIGGFQGDAGVLGRKIVVDSYHGFYHVGGGAQSGKDATKVDRSGAYKARQIAMRYLEEFKLDWCEVQLSYAIGISKPMSIMINSNKGVITPTDCLYEECTPKNIIKDLNLQKPIFLQTAKCGHYGHGFNWERVV